MARPKKTTSAAKKTTKTAKKPTVRKTAKAPRAPETKSATLSATDLHVTVSATERKGWNAAAASLAPDEVNLTMPLAVLLGESIDVAKFARSRWEPARDKEKITAPGLSSAVRRDLKIEPFAVVPALHEGTAQEMLVLHALTQEAQTRWLLSSKTASADRHPRQAGAELLSDVRGAVESYLDDGVETHEDAQLRAVNEAHANDPETDDALATALVDYAALAESLLPGLDGYADFSPAWVSRARHLAAELRVAPATGAPSASGDRTELDARDRLATLLARRVRLVRAKARFVFRAHPTLVREVTSTYERRRRAASRRAKKTDASNPPA